MPKTSEPNPEPESKLQVPTEPPQTTPPAPMPIKLSSPPPLPLALSCPHRNLPPVKYDLLHKHGKTVLPGHKVDIPGLLDSKKSDEVNLAEACKLLKSVIAEDATYNIVLKAGPTYMEVVLAAIGVDKDNRPTFADVMKGPEQEFWREATSAEISQLWATKTFELAMLPKGMKAIKCGWVLNKKQNADGIII
ncbi:hypothetical protein OPQ81_011078 [Rhizoctonia solani]|nr:hypothetical protein OPQ81_011078 [Rhizoctonia solani]